MAIQKSSTRTGTGEVAVAPLNTMHLNDVKAGIKSFDTWLQKISDGYVSVDRLKQIAGSVPVVGNVLALVDVMGDVKRIVEKPKPELMDWVDLGLDVIGVIPIPPTLAAARMSLRPAVFLARQSLKKNAKAVGGGIADVVIGVLVDHLNEKIAGELDKFAANAQPLLNDMLKTSGTKAQAFCNDLAGGLDRVLEGHVFTNSSSNMSAAAKQMQKASKNSWHNPLATISNVYHAVSNVAKAGIKETANLYAGAATHLIPKGAKIPMHHAIGQLRGLGKIVPAKLMSLGDANTAMSIGWILVQLTKAAKEYYLRKKRKKANVKPKETTKADHKKPNGELEKTAKQEKAKSNPNECKNGCKVKSSTGGSITFALGTEFISHVDFQLPTVMPLVWERRYASNLSAMDDGVFGARWTTPFTTQIYRKDGEFVYVGADARPIPLPNVAVGESYDDPIEGLILSCVSDEMLVVSFGAEQIEVYERAGHVYRLASIQWRGGATLGLRYDHQVQGKEILSDVILRQGKVDLAHIACKANSDGKIASLWLVVEGVLSRQLASYEYDTTGDLLAAENEYGATHHYQYQYHLLTRYTDLTGRGLNIEWDGTEATARAMHEWADDGSFDVHLEWDENIRLTYVTDAHGNETWHYYDILGYPYRVVYPDGLEEWFFRDEAKNIVKHAKTDGSVDIFEYDERSNLLTHIQPDGSSVHFAYSEDDLLTDIVDAERGLWKREYDTQGRLIAEIDPLNHKTEYEYNAFGLPTQITDARGGKKEIKYTEAGQLASYTDCSGKTTQWSYDRLGRLNKVTNAADETTTYQYTDQHSVALTANSLGQLEAITHADGAKEQFVHDAEGRLLVHTDPLGRQTEYSYTAAGFIANRRDATGQTLTYGWDRLGRLHSLINENGAQYRFEYDPVGRLLKEKGFDDKTVSYKYAPENGRLINSIEAVPPVIGNNPAEPARVYRYTFDDMGRLEERGAGFLQAGQVTHSLTESYGYDRNGRLAQAKNDACRLQWFYDDAGNLTHEHQHFTETQLTAVWVHEYDELNQRVATIRPDGQRIDWLTYGSGHVHGILLNGKEVLGFERDNLHREILRLQQNDLVQTKAYDPAGRLKEQVLKASETAERTQGSLVKRSYDYDRAGQLTGINDTRRGNLGYRYDPVGRLIEANSSLGKELFAFDPASNIIDPDKAQQRILDTPTSARYAGAEPMVSHLTGTNRLVDNMVREFLGQDYKYDAYGQLIARRDAGLITYFKWDAFGRLIEAQNPKTQTTTFTYDALGRRISKKNSQLGRTYFGWDGDTLAYESDLKTTTHYIYEPNSFVPLLQTVYKQPLRMHNTPNYTGDYDFNTDPLWHIKVPRVELDQVNYYTCDHLGTPQELTSNNGEIVWSAKYKAWGQAYTQHQNVQNNIRFQGQYFDVETGLHYNRFRYYDPNSGRFVSKDPIKLFGGLNIHAYAPNPISWIDPWGLKVLYRSMSMDEYNTLKSTGKWSSIPGSMDGKWMAESYANAKIWGNAMGHGGCEFMIVQVTVPDQVANQMHHDPHLDGIGTARYATNDQLNQHGHITWKRKEKQISSSCKFK